MATIVSTSKVFKVLNNPNRIKILKALLYVDKTTSRTIKEIAHDTKIKEPTVSAAMKILCRYGLAEKQDTGPFILYWFTGAGTDAITHIQTLLAAAGALADTYNFKS